MIITAAITSLFASWPGNGFANVPRRIDTQEGSDMKPLLHVQMDLFASPARPPGLISSERQKAITLLRALLMEADVPASRGDGELGNE
jgi:hypothetical protein